MYSLKPDALYVWSNKTFIFFVIIAMFAMVLPYIGIIKVKFSKKSKRVPIGLIILTILLIGIKGFSAVGRDVLSGYYAGFLSADSLKTYSDPSVELGYRILTVIVHNIWNNYTFFLIVVATLTVIPVVHFTWKYQEHIFMGITLFLYTTIYYFQGLSLLRIFLAASIGLVAIDRLITKKNKSAFIWILVAVLFHTSMLVLFIPYTIFVFNKLSRGSYILSLVVIFIFFSVYGNQIVGSLSGRYAVYRNTFSSGLGFQQVIYYAPIATLIYFGHKFQNKKGIVEENKAYKLSWALIISGFFIGEVGYVITIFGRAQVAFISLIFVISYYAKRIYVRDVKWGNFARLLIVIYGLARLYIYLSQYYNVDSIMPYSTIWGLIF